MPVPCDRCEGEGQLAKNFGIDSPGKPEIETCSKCHGSGQMWDPAAEPDYDRITVLPGRAEKLRELLAAGHDIALVTNQGGVAFGHQTEGQVFGKIFDVMAKLGLDEGWIRTEAGFAEIDAPPLAYVALKHADATVEGMRAEPGDTWRKPGGGMILQAIYDHGYGDAPEEVAYVGDLPTDRKAAEEAGVEFVDARVFFEEEEVPA